MTRQIRNRRNHLSILLFSLTIAGVVLSCTFAAHAQLFGEAGLATPQESHVEAALVSEVTSIQPGHPFWVGLHLTLDKEWHVYWRNPGDAGLPTKIEWHLPNGFTAGDIQWPYPGRFDFAPLTNYGYSDEVLFPIEITPPPDLKPGSSVTLNGYASWLVCKGECVPGGAEVSLTLKVDTVTPAYNDHWSKQFSTTRDLLPIKSSDWKIRVSSNDKYLFINLAKPSWYTGFLKDVTFFPYQQKVIEYARPQKLTETEDGYELRIERSHLSESPPVQLAGVLVTDSGWRGDNSEKAMEFDEPVTAGSGTAAASTGTGALSIWQALLFAFLGGMILNLMPCVLPVLSLKILGFVKQADESKKKALSHGLVFTAGVLVSFWVLVGVLLALRAGGEELGWGFQLQSPEFLIILSGFMFLFGLNMLGVFEIGTSLTAVGGKTASKSGWGGSFLNGITATVVATPCTAPFMGSALGYSLTQPIWIVWLIFTFLALGMAAPYVVLSASPALLRFLPKPGRWMETLKQFMGFLLLATVIWLSWVLSVQAGALAVVLLLAVLLLLGVGALILGRWCVFSASSGKRYLAYVLAAVFIIGGVTMGILGVGTTSLADPSSTTTSSLSGEDAIAWQPYSQQRWEQLKNSDSVVFIDFTAAWCLSCQVNERVAFSSAEVQRKFADLKIVPLKADWTARNEEITEALAGYGRNSVPLYVLYGPDKTEDPIILPEIITPGIVIDALTRIGQ